MSGAPPPTPKAPGVGRGTKIALGAVLGAAALPLLLLLGMLVGTSVDVFWFVWLAPLVVPVAGVALMVDRGTRPWGTGVLIGFFGMLIVGGGACVLLIAGISGGLG